MGTFVDVSVITFSFPAPPFRTHKLMTRHRRAFQFMLKYGKNKTTLLRARVISHCCLAFRGLPNVIKLWIKENREEAFVNLSNR